MEFLPFIMLVGIVIVCELLERKWSKDE